MKGDARILGQGECVESVLKASQEDFDRKHLNRTRGQDFEWLVERATSLHGLTPKEGG